MCGGEGGRVRETLAPCEERATATCRVWILILTSYLLCAPGSCENLLSPDPRGSSRASESEVEMPGGRQAEPVLLEAPVPALEQLHRGFQNLRSFHKPRPDLWRSLS